ncbi:mannose-P-dolichol utilization defect 1 protein [Teratosphaeria destructans]|uniref:Mannose-P-dolichol utilization defect 1 protein n=1 Tax=Teratosphaeria destructans TaxID=418781 RepID=A0A9W7W0T4_9PEZI|nr:mannose-P-dolichol utilization defect 1 protein [Teratosphaeria destructans]
MAPTPPSGALAHLESTLRGLLQPITHHLPEPLVQTGHTLLGEHCYTSLIHSLNLLSDPACLKLAISKALGIAIIGASSIVKIPQLLKLLHSQSAAGVSFLSYLLETSSYLITLMYNVRNGFPFSTYGELALIAVQNVAISVLVLQFSGKGPAAAAWVAGLAAAAYALYDDSVVSAGLLQYLQAGAGVLGVASKLPQIITIVREGGTGQLSAFAVSSHRTLPCIQPRPTCAAKSPETGLQLPPRLPRPRLHDPPRGRRHAHPVRLPRGRRAQRRPRRPDGLLLGSPGEPVHDADEAHAEWPARCQAGGGFTYCGWHDGRHHDERGEREEHAQYATKGLDSGFLRYRAHRNYLMLLMSAAYRLHPTTDVPLSHIQHAGPTPKLPKQSMHFLDSMPCHGLPA